NTPPFHLHIDCSLAARRSVRLSRMPVPFACVFSSRVALYLESCVDVCSVA
ncbi:hypothetical protein J6590_107204, partial [Homalodisca vitripennis]